MTRADPPAHTGTQKKSGTATGRAPGHDVTREELSPARGFPAGVAIAVLALILVGTLIFALFLAPETPDLSPNRGTTVILDDDAVGTGTDLGE
jgi:hypothetical protein